MAMINILDNESLIDRVLFEEALNLSNSWWETNTFHVFLKVYNEVPTLFNIESRRPTVFSNLFKEIQFNCNDISDFYKQIIKEHDCIVREVFGHTLIFFNNFIMHDTRIICNSKDADNIAKEIRGFLPEAKTERYIKYVANNRDDYNVIPFKINNYTGDIELNYNDDLPLDRLHEIIKEEKSSITILHGTCGTGKTYILRYLINKNPDVEFYWFDAKLIQDISSVNFLNFIINNKNAVYIIEDCEYLLAKRDDTGNTLLSSVLNISDGMLGDALNIKFICTFNTDIENIDPAVLRKGRLALKYEFKELESDKVKALAESLGIDIPEIKPMPLCDIYNYLVDNGTNKKEQKKIGF